MVEGEEEATFRGGGNREGRGSPVPGLPAAGRSHMVAMVDGVERIATNYFFQQED